MSMARAASAEREAELEYKPSDYYLDFASDVLYLGYSKAFPDISKHPDEKLIRKFIDLFSSLSLADKNAHDPRTHSFNESIKWNNTLLSYAYLVIAAEYVLSLGSKVHDIEDIQLEEAVLEAFDPEKAGRSIAAVNAERFAPLESKVFLEFVIPHILVAQAERFLKVFAPAKFAEMQLYLNDGLSDEQDKAPLGNNAVPVNPNVVSSAPVTIVAAKVESSPSLSSTSSTMLALPPKAPAEVKQLTNKIVLVEKDYFSVPAQQPLAQDTMLAAPAPNPVKNSSYKVVEGIQRLSGVVMGMFGMRFRNKPKVVVPEEPASSIKPAIL